MNNVNEPISQGRLVIVCGMSGSGKTTLAKRIAHETGGVRMSPDDWMVHLGVDIWDGAVRNRIESLQWQLAKELLVAGNVVIIEWGTWARTERDTLRLGARELGAAVELRYLDVQPDVVWQRIQKRGFEQTVGSRAVTREDVSGWFANLQPPTGDELALFDTQYDALT